MIYNIDTMYAYLIQRVQNLRKNRMEQYLKPSHLDDHKTWGFAKKTHVFNRCGTPRRLLNGVHLLTCLPFGWDPHRCAASWPLRCKKNGWSRRSGHQTCILCWDLFTFQWVYSTKIRTLYLYIYIIYTKEFQTSKKLERNNKKRRTKCEVLVTSIHRLLYWEHSNHCSRFLSHWRNASWKTETTWNNASGMLVNIPWWFVRDWSLDMLMTFFDNFISCDIW